MLLYSTIWAAEACWSLHSFIN